MAQSNEQLLFLELYSQYRYKDFINFYKNRSLEFKKARTQAHLGSIGLMLLAAISDIVISLTDVSWVKLTCLFISAILPLLSIVLIAYSSFYAFDQQSQLYEDAANALLQVRAIYPMNTELSEAEFTAELNEFVMNVETIFSKEQGQWGQLAKGIKL